MRDSTASKPPVYSVSQLSRFIHDALEENFPSIWVEGEVSDPRTFPSGHTYFTLKDEASQISAVLFRGAAAAVRFTLEHGLVVVARGRVSSYEKRGQYQLIVAELQPKTAGALQLAFEQLKKKLAAEGLFDESRKRPLPAFPRRIGIVSSLQGAALRDMLSVLKRRFTGLDIRVLPVPVQGVEAAPKIAAAIEDFNEHFPDTEVLLVGRGGGSLEDLWAFNEEAVARAISASRIPVISAVGHETDFTIADFAADLRAPTPSAAAELAVPDRAAAARNLDSLSARLGPALTAAVSRLDGRLRALTRSPFLRDPMRIFETKAQRIDDLTGRLLSAIREPGRRAADRLAALGPRLAPALRRAAAGAEMNFRRVAGKLDALSPLRVLARGYAIARKKDGAVIRSVKDVRAADGIMVRVGDGEFNARVT